MPLSKGMRSDFIPINDKTDRIDLKEKDNYRGILWSRIHLNWSEAYTFSTNLSYYRIVFDTTNIKKQKRMPSLLFGFRASGLSYLWMIFCEFIALSVWEYNWHSKSKGRNYNWKLTYILPGFLKWVSLELKRL